MTWDELAVQSARGERGAFEQLLQLADRMLAKEARRAGYDYEEALQEARIALFNATKKFDPARGAFPSYAKWLVRQRLQRIRIKQSTVPTRTTRFQRELGVFLGMHPNLTLEQVAVQMGVTLQTVRDNLPTGAPVTLVTEQEENTPGMVWPCPSPSPEDTAHTSFRTQRLQALLQTFTPQEQEWVSLLLGGASFEEVGALRGVTRQAAHRHWLRLLTRLQEGLSQED